MLIGSLGIRLIMWLGAAVPLPPPPGLLQALTDVTVTNDADGDDGFQLTLSIGKNELLDYGLLAGGALDPMSRVIIGVLMGVVPEVLLDGVITHHQLQPSNEPGRSTLTVTGMGLTQVLDLEERNAKYENQPDSLIFVQVISRYAQYGLVPQPTPTTEVPIIVQRIPRQHETDLAFVRRLAQRAVAHPKKRGDRVEADIGEELAQARLVDVARHAHLHPGLPQIRSQEIKPWREQG